ncbi:MAG: hypothetical protein QM296_02640 [Bacillota bacterium]|nr:hypothetical protein [Bacillota bacterium]
MKDKQYEHEEVWLPAYRELQDKERLGDDARARILAAMQERAKAGPADRPATQPADRPAARTAAARRISSFPAKRWLVPAVAAALAVTLGVFWAAIMNGQRDLAPLTGMKGERPSTADEVNYALKDEAEAAPEAVAEADILEAEGATPEEERELAAIPDPVRQPTAAATREAKTPETKAASTIVAAYDGADLSQLTQEEAASKQTGLQDLLAPLQLADAAPGQAQVLIGAPEYLDEAVDSQPPESIRIEAIRAVYADGRPLDPTKIRIRVKGQEAEGALNFAENIKLPAWLTIDTSSLSAYRELVIELVVDGESVLVVLDISR